MKITVIGGGIIGLSTAHYLLQAGHEVTVIDQSSLNDGCSFGNAGMIVPSHIIPLASPGMIARGIRWMFRSDSPFYIRPRWDTRLFRWGWQFYRHSTKNHVKQAAPALKELSLFSKKMYRELATELPFDFGYAERGLLMLYQSPGAQHEEEETARFANTLGIEARVLPAAEVQRLEPEVELRVLGGVYYPGDAHLIPHNLMKQWIPYLNKQGVNFKTGEEVKDFRISKSRIEAVITTGGEYQADEVVLAAGSWSEAIAAKLDLKLPIQAGKGYSFLTDDTGFKVQIPSILLEARVAVTPMGNKVRLGGTMEIAGISHQINMNRVRGIVEAVPRYYPNVKINMPEADEVWAGLRPCSPDGLPYIGRTSRYTNLVIATGHAMMGLSLGPGTGKLVSLLINNQATPVTMEPFHPDRF
ncbi:MAG: FAD-dependent oxidoreductase [Cyclobacteriaceae bacterium]|nr:FAD-dependent oxidoreductase [Cyclobacteriaceae bacterium]